MKKIPFALQLTRKQTFSKIHAHSEGFQRFRSVPVPRSGTGKVEKKNSDFRRNKVNKSFFSCRCRVLCVDVFLALLVPWRCECSSDHCFSFHVF